MRPYAEELLRIPDEAAQIDGQVDARLPARHHLPPQHRMVLLDLLRAGAVDPERISFDSGLVVSITRIRQPAG